MDSEANDLESFKRMNVDKEKYVGWKAGIEAQYGSITMYLLDDRLPKAWGRPPFSPDSPDAFISPSDYYIMLNDWPYGFTPDITHMIIWTRNTIPVEAGGGDMTPEGRNLVGSFVKKHFTDKLMGQYPDQRVLWFKNWNSLQSVNGIDHIHVLVRGAAKAVVDNWVSEK